MTMIIIAKMITIDYHGIFSLNIDDQSTRVGPFVCYHTELGDSSRHEMMHKDNDDVVLIYKVVL